jgi:hypothetical protein
MRFIVFATIVALITDIALAEAPRSPSLGTSLVRFLRGSFYLCGNETLKPIFCPTNRTTCETNGTSGEAFCRCIDGYGGERCQEDIDECLESYPCADGDKSTSFCVNYLPPKKFKCGCHSGYDAILPDDTDITDPVPVEWRPIKCLPKNVCLDSLLCHVNATCTNDPPNSFNCTCNHGLVGDGIKVCTPPTPPVGIPAPPKDACESDSECAIRLGNNAECASAVCVCKKGFFRTPGQGQCENEDECIDDGRNDCHRDAICEDTEGSYKCKCKDGFHDVNTTLPPGRVCAQINECLDPTQNDCDAATQVCLDRRPPTKWECVQGTTAPTLAPVPVPIVATTTAAATTAGCFPAEALVMVKNKGQVAMHNLHIGDHVLGLNGKFHPVYAFGHQDFTGAAEYVRLYTNGTLMSPLEISADHFLFLREQQDFPVLPASLKKGDIVLGTGNQPFMVTKIENVMSKGIFAPLTADGTIVVNGIACSTYTFALPRDDDSSDYLYFSKHKIVTQNEFIHMRYSPLRLAALGASPWFGKLALESDGRNYLCVAYHQAYKWMMKSDSRCFQAMGFVIWHFLLALGIFSYTIECSVGATRGPAVILTSLVVWFSFCRQKTENMDSKLKVNVKQRKAA